MNGYPTVTNPTPGTWEMLKNGETETTPERIDLVTCTSPYSEKSVNSGLFIHEEQKVHALEDSSDSLNNFVLLSP